MANEKEVNGQTEAPDFEKMYNELKVQNDTLNVRYDGLNKDYQKLAKAFNKLFDDYRDLYLKVLFTDEPTNNR